MTQALIVLRALVGSILVVSFATKTARPQAAEAFAVHVMPRLGNHSRFAVRGVAAAEGVAGSLLVLGLGTAQMSAAMAAGILLLTVLSVRAMASGYTGSCGCFGSLSGHDSGWFHVAFNLLLASGLIAVGLFPASAPLREQVPAVLIAGAIVAVVVLMHALQSLVTYSLTPPALPESNIGSAWWGFYREEESS